MSRPEIGLHIKGKPMNRKKAACIINDHSVNGLSYRSLEKKYGISRSSIYRMVMSKQEKHEQKQASAPAGEDALPDDVDILKAEIRKLKLKIELQDIMIDISSKELGVDLRKKHGTR